MVDVERSKLESGLTLLWLLRATTARTRVSWWNPTDLQECCRPPWSFATTESFLIGEFPILLAILRARSSLPRPRTPARLDRPLPPVRH
jgi:hypothetical protein